jgi:hypothetical protein
VTVLSNISSDVVRIQEIDGRTVLSPKNHHSDWMETDQAITWHQWSEQQLGAFHDAVQSRVAEKLGRGNLSAGMKLFNACTDNFRTSLMQREWSGDLDAAEVHEAVSQVETSLAQHQSAIADARTAAWAEGEKKEKARLAAIHRNLKVKGNEALAMDFAEAMPEQSAEQVVDAVVAAVGQPVARQTIPTLQARLAPFMEMYLGLGAPLSADQRSSSAQIDSPDKIYAARKKACAGARNAKRVSDSSLSPDGVG